MDFDATDTLDQANTVTSNVAALLRGAIDAGEAGVRALLEQARPIAEQLDGLFSDSSEPVPAPPQGGVSTTESFESDAAAAGSLGVS